MWGIWIWGRPSLISSVDKSDSSEKKWNHFLYQIIYRKAFKGKNLSNTRIEMIIDKPLVGLIKSVWNQLCCFFFFIEDFVVLEWSQLSQSLGLNNWKKFLAGRYHEFFFFCGVITIFCYQMSLLYTTDDTYLLEYTVLTLEKPQEMRCKVIKFVHALKDTTFCLFSNFKLWQELRKILGYIYWTNVMRLNN